MKLSIALLLSLALVTGKDKDIFSPKSIENRMVLVAANLYANKYETTNREYREFLAWVETNDPDLTETVKVHEENWTPFVKGNYNKYYSQHKAFDQYPAVNISYEAATEFCTWLTEQYHQNKKRKYEQVKFRLPTEAEWVEMAVAGKAYDPSYPWGGPYLKNKKGCYLANFYTVGNHKLKIDINNRSEIEVVPDQNIKFSGGNDEYLFTAPVSSFVATGAGLHNLSGNVAEMLAEKGRTKGGSWGSSGYYVRIDAEDEFEGFETSPYVGFRYVMEVIKE